MSYLRGFLPWIALAIVSTLGWQWGALAGLVLGAAMLIRARKAGLAADALILECSTVAFFTALTVFAFARPDSGLKDYVGALALSWLAVTAWTTLAVGRPFTTGIARRQAPPEVWDTYAFRHINVVITRAWSIAFTLSAAAMVVVVSAGLGVVAALVAQFAGFVLPALFTAWYPGWARSRLAPAAHRA
ncbi:MULTISPECIES: hypothetical protein [Streptomyces violaceusniger group]|uniref:Uncharacterized protein n=2 Tax=Streptomyces javensis TaxID=114698 RepID=A0ABS0R6N4_9ACTN|nr:hypothetical protein [Streptomyces javensis]MBI0312745.1 hypothetical protein [Streptomyces javensis]